MLIYIYYFLFFILIARANATFIGIDYTFRREFDSLFSKEKKGEINYLKQRKNELQMKQHIYDLEKTISINQDCINKIIHNFIKSRLYQ